VLYVAATLAALLITPFPDQFKRYLLPTVPILALSAIVFLRDIPTENGRWFFRRNKGLSAPIAVLVPALLVQIVIATYILTHEYRPVSYVDKAGKQVAYRLFFYDAAAEGFERATDYVRAHAGPTDIVAAGVPHWIYLRTGLKVVMTPFERDAEEAQRLLDSVPVTYLLVGHDALLSERYMRPVVERHPDQWQRVYSTDLGDYRVYRRVEALVSSSSSPDAASVR
jgi:hypothetical protein